MAFIDLGFHRVEAHVNLGNVPSTKWAESAGLKFEDKRKSFLFGDGSGPIIWFISQIQQYEPFTIARAILDNQLSETCRAGLTIMQVSDA